MLRQITTYCISACLLLLLASSCKKDSSFKHQAGSPVTIEQFTPGSGSGTTQILITGTNFTADPDEISVTINGNKLPVVGVNGNQIMVVVPKKCGSGKLKIRIGTDSTESTASFTYHYTRTVSTLAGNGKAGFANGKGTEAQFNFNGQFWYRSNGIAVDDDLNVYVADPGNACIRKIDSAGNVTTYAGFPGNPGNAEGTGTAARFYMPYSLALDKDRNVYVADVLNWNIRKITTDGYASWYSGMPAEPWGIAVDKNTGYVYVSCINAGSIYQSKAAWSFDPIVTGLNYPGGIAVDNNSNLYVTGHGDHTIRKLDAGTWKNTVIAGQPGSSGYVDGPGPNARFIYPWSVATDKFNNVYVATNGTTGGDPSIPDQSIRFIEAGTWVVSTFAGSGTAGYIDAIGTSAAFSAPNGVCVDKYGTVYVLDKNNNSIRKIVSE
ncbi:SBBP repeat-containing protein [Paraflavitalea sp. CAU 1676]|uniref:SBBP repeat-containing protein n=1 Tax=Paraflavitalea sp. CAU 1676 TaxID=3032598 RepID=UPI0023DC0BF4|nr:SBBP repeat-containing protein [Paraflavitalea sp. CAU 1676]MDF2190144.1 IPT/TIG domain-containing protein [Paraflavitalea sp. CAU 1676]